jgi:hypothetical protein
VNTVVPAIDPIEALTTPVPWLTLVTNPGFAPLLNANTPGLLDVHVTAVVRFEIVPFLKYPVAVNCCVSPKETL